MNRNSLARNTEQKQFGAQSTWVPGEDVKFHVGYSCVGKSKEKKSIRRSVWKKNNKVSLKSAFQEEVISTGWMPVKRNGTLQSRRKHWLLYRVLQNNVLPRNLVLATTGLSQKPNLILFSPCSWFHSLSHLSCAITFCLLSLPTQRCFWCFWKTLSCRDIVLDKIAKVTPCVTDLLCGWTSVSLQYPPCSPEAPHQQHACTHTHMLQLTAI